MDAVRKLILEKVDELGTNLSELSKGIGRNHAYLQQFINRGVPESLPEKVRPALAAKLNVKPSDLVSARLRQEINQIVTGIKTPIVTAARREPQSSEPAELVPATQLLGLVDLPVFGTAQGGRGALIVTNDAVDRVVRPDSLLRVKDGYGMIVTGDSMAPEHKSGSIALVNPHLPPRAGESCVFRRHDDDGTVYACIKELRRWTETSWHVRQHNPKRDFTLKRSEWQVCHVTVGNYFRR